MNTEQIGKLIEARAIEIAAEIGSKYGDYIQAFKAKEVQPREEALFKKLGELGYGHHFSIHEKWLGDYKGTDEEKKEFADQEFRGKDLDPEEAWKVRGLIDDLNGSVRSCFDDQGSYEGYEDIGLYSTEGRGHVDTLIIELLEQHNPLDDTEFVGRSKERIGYFTSEDFPSFSAESITEVIFEENEEAFIEAYQMDQAEAKAKDRWSKAPSHQEAEEDDTPEVKKTNRFKR